MISCPHGCPIKNIFYPIIGNIQFFQHKTFQARGKEDWNTLNSLVLSAILQGWNYFRLGRRSLGQQGYPQSNIISLTTISRPSWHNKLSVWADHLIQDKNKVCVQVTGQIVQKSFTIWTHTNRMIISHQTASISTENIKIFSKNITVQFHLVMKTEVRTR